VHRLEKAAARRTSWRRGGATSGGEAARHYRKGRTTIFARYKVQTLKPSTRAKPPRRQP
jgi:hypothetical protein